MARPRLAVTLETLGTEGAQGFYNGTIAGNIVRDIGAAGGVITAEDLSSYRSHRFFTFFSSLRPVAYTLFMFYLFAFLLVPLLLPLLASCADL